jgi:hypothetical protein
MGFRFYRRVKLFGGVGLNFSKSGISPSIRTPFGTVSSKGVTIRTGIKGLSFRISNSHKREAGDLFRAEYDITNQKSTEFVSRIERIKRFNGKEIGYHMPNSNYDAILSELVPLIELGREIDAELIELQAITRQHRLGMMPSMNTLRRELAKLMSELEAVWTSLYQNKQQYLAEAAAVPPEISVIRMTCFNCQQDIELNDDAAPGQQFNCPTCQTELFVPGDEAVTT